MKYAVIYEHGPNDEGRETWSAYVPDLPGCVSAGDTREECEAMIREAISAHIQVLHDEGLPFPLRQVRPARLKCFRSPSENLD